MVVTFPLAARPARGGEIVLGGRTFTLPDGFTIEYAAKPPTVSRPIEADFDEQGRLYVTEAAGAIDRGEFQGKSRPHRAVRLEDTVGQGTFDKRSVFAEQLTFPEGAMWYRGSFYTSTVPAIWKLTDTNGKGVADQRTLWFDGKTATGCANDLHGPYLGPDGFFYWCKGAFAEQTYARPGHRPLETRAAHIFRARPDGSMVEPVMTGGMDNPVEVAFMPDGERIVSSTFLQEPAGGHRDGLIHAIYGGIYGKVHSVTDDHPHTSPDLMPVLSHLGPAAVCGLTRYESDAFGPEYLNNLFATCFNLHKVTRHVLRPDGATFKSEDHDFLTCDALDFHPTDVIEEADGSLLIIDTGGWYTLCCPTSKFGKTDLLGAIYRIRRSIPGHIEDPRGLKLAWSTMTPGECAAHLGDARPAIRKRAIQALADQGARALPTIERCFKDGTPATRLNAVWAATRIDGAEARATARRALTDVDETVRHAAIHSVSVWRDKESVTALTERLKSKSMPEVRVAAEALGRMGDAAAIPELLAALEHPTDQVLNHSITFALIEIDDAGATAAGLRSQDARVRRAALIALDQMEHHELGATTVLSELSSPDFPMRETSAWIASRHPEWGELLARALRDRIASHTLQGREAESLQKQLARLCKSRAVCDMLAALVQTDSSTASIQLALGAMGSAELRETPAAWPAALSHALHSGDAGVLRTALDAIAHLPPGKALEQLAAPVLDVASRPDVPASLRLKASNALPGETPTLGAGLFAFLTEQLVSGGSLNERLDAARAVGHAKLTIAQLSELSDSIKNVGPLEISPALGAFEHCDNRDVGLNLVVALEQSKGRNGLRPEKLKLVVSKFGPDIEKKAEPLLASLNPDAARQKARIDELLRTIPEGDVTRGKIVFNSPKIGCTGCHAIGYVGGRVGPDLTRVGQIRSPRDLLESILYPSASFVQTFEPVMVIVKTGDNVYGIPREENSDGLEIVTGPTLTVHISKSNVKEIRPGTVSIMPEGLDAQLSPQDLADLLVFLKAAGN